MSRNLCASADLVQEWLDGHYCNSCQVVLSLAWIPVAAQWQKRCFAGCCLVV